MSELAQDPLVVEIEKTGERTDKILKYSITSNYLTPTDAFEFTVFDEKDPRGLRRRFYPERRVRLFIDGAQQLTGRIDSTEGNDDGSLTVHGRDYRSEIIDGGADPSMTFKENQDLGDALLMLFRPFGIRTLYGNFNLSRNLLTGQQPFKGIPVRDFKTATLKEFKVEANKGAYEVANEIVSRHGFTIQQMGTRSWLGIVEPQFNQPVLYQLSRPGNLLSGRAKRDYGDVPTVTIATGRAVGSEPGKQADPMFGQFPTFGELSPLQFGNNEEILRITSTDYGGDELQTKRVDWKKTVSEAEDFVLYKPLFFEDKKSRTPQQLERLIRKELSRRAKETLTYTCSVRGHRNPESGAIYTIDTVAEVTDEVEDLTHQQLWVLERRLYNEGQGPRTDMKLIRQGSITL